MRIHTSRQVMKSKALGCCLYARIVRLFRFVVHTSYLHTVSCSSRLESSMCSAVALLVRPDVINPGPKHRNRRSRICLRCPGSTLQHIPYSCTFTSTMSSDLRQTVLRSNAREQHTDDAASDEDWVNVVRAFALKTGWSSSPPLQQTDLSRPQSPIGKSPGRTTTAATTASRKNTRDPLRALPSDLNQRIFASLGIRDLARCSRVSKRWSRSQTINYVWFQMYRADNYQDDSLPPGKWTKRESKQNWVSHTPSYISRSS
jgi:hypothetical protein